MGDSIACHRCGQMLDSESAFCPHCGAPQIRVPAVAEPESSEAEAPVPEIPVDSSAIQWPRAFRAIFAPAVFATAAMLVPIIGIGAMLWVAVAGHYSVRLYRRRAASARIDAGIGAKLGAAVGFTCCVLISALCGVYVAIVKISGHSLRAYILERIRATAPFNPNAQPTVDQLTHDPQLIVPAVVFAFLVIFVVFIVCGTVGGAIAGSSEARRSRPR